MLFESRKTAVQKLGGLCLKKNSFISVSHLRDSLRANMVK